MGIGGGGGVGEGTLFARHLTALSPRKAGAVRCLVRGTAGTAGTAEGERGWVEVKEAGTEKGTEGTLSSLFPSLPFFLFRPARAGPGPPPMGPLRPKRRAGSSARVLAPVAAFLGMSTFSELLASAIGRPNHAGRLLSARSSRAQGWHRMVLSWTVVEKRREIDAPGPPLIARIRPAHM